VNEGFIVRQRIGVFPSLLVLFAIPLVQRKHLQTVKKGGEKDRNNYFGERDEFLTSEK